MPGRALQCSSVERGRERNGSAGGTHRVLLPPLTLHPPASRPSPPLPPAPPRRSKVEMVKRHAEELQQSVLKNPNVTAENIHTLSEEEKSVLRRRLDTADAVLDRISKHHASKEEELSFTGGWVGEVGGRRRGCACVPWG
jgi:hypothetical protein